MNEREKKRKMDFIHLTMSARDEHATKSERNMGTCSRITFICCIRIEFWGVFLVYIGLSTALTFAHSSYTHSQLRSLTHVPFQFVVFGFRVFRSKNVIFIALN